MEECDVLVAGGGSAGLAAAIAAARLGARTLLVERHGALGGMVSAALVHSICGLYRLRADDDGNDNSPPALANAGFAAEFTARLLDAGGARGPVRMGRVDVLLQRPVAFARLADELARQTPRLDVRLHTELIGSGGNEATLLCRGRQQRWRAGAFVDTTGDAALAALRGAPCETPGGARLQRPAFIFALGGVAAEALGDDARLRLAQRIARAVHAGDLPADALGTHLRAGTQEGEAFVTIDLDGGRDFDPLDPVCLSGLEMEGRALGGRLADFFRAEAQGFSAGYVAAWPTRAGVRESRQVVGRYRIEGEEIERGEHFPDVVAFAAWPMELRETARGARWRFPAGSRPPCGIPLRALRARDDAALFVAGRCLSCDHEAQASLRVIGTCLATGEAAGLAAALQALGRPGDAAAVNAAREEVARG